MHRKILILFIGLALATAARAQTRKQLEAKRVKVQNDIAYTRGILQKTGARKNAELHKLSALNEIIRQRNQVIQGLRVEISQADSELHKQTATLKELQKEFDLERSRLQKTVLKAYKSRKNANSLAYVFAAGSFRQAVKRMVFLKKLSEFRNSMLGRVQEKAGKVKHGIQLVAGTKQEKTQLLSGSEQEKQGLEKDKALKRSVVVSLEGKEAQLKKQLRNNEVAVARLNSSISAMIAKEIAAARARALAEQRKRNAAVAAAGKPAAKPGSKPGTKPAAVKESASASALTPEAQQLNDNFASNRGGLPWPLERGYISQGYGVHAHPDLAGITLVNNGVDITTSPGSQVRSVFRGTVSAIIDIPGQEKAILINHGNYYTVYSRLSSVVVSRGMVISAKQNLGTVWTDGDGKTILQFQLWQGQAKQNPAGWLAPR